MRTNLAFANIRSSLTRTLISVAGIGIAVVLIFMQLGFRGAVESTATTIYGKMDFDVIVRSKDYLHFVDSRQISMSLSAVIKSVPGTQKPTPFYVSMGNWRHPKGELIRGVIIMGTPFGSSPFADTDLTRKIRRLTAKPFVLIDQKTHFEFGPVNKRKFGDEDIGVITNVTNSAVKIVGHFEIGAGLTAHGSIITSDRGFEELLGGAFNVQKNTSMFLVKLDNPDNATLVASQINNRLPNTHNAVALTREEVMQAELTRWIDQTPLGFVFTLGVIVSFIVGSAIVFMVLSNDVTNRLPEYATLKAMGYTNYYLSTIVLRQATYLAFFAFVPALATSLVLYQVTSFLANISIQMTLVRMLAVLLLSVMMCWLSGVGALKKLWQAEPASLF